MVDVDGTVEAVVVGAGVIGLAVARTLALEGRQVMVLESEKGIGSGTSSRNSEVIHAGIYYPLGSRKARLCLEGRELLYAYAEERAIPHRRLGKLIVGVDQSEIAALDRVHAHAAANGVPLERLSGGETRRLEPALRAEAALFSPHTGIIDSHGLMLAYQADAEQAGAQFVFRTYVQHVERSGEGFIVTAGGTRLGCRVVVNAAGLSAVALAQRIEGLLPECVPSAYYCKGSYYTLTGRAPFRHLIYPVPEHAGLGVHLTLDLAGQARFGPDTEWVDALDYAVEPQRVASFAQAIRRYWPGLPECALQPGYSGIRPKINGPHEPAADFRIDGPPVHGIPGLVNLFGIESPGLTASLAIADEVARQLR